ncbi:hypothetical protein LA66_10930 [Aureimonas altamirensis]|uniref:Uncharacterized protein n=1 Tax=Aureimonas altamirensis TaxID=370622 RepID=A0A0B1Q2I4_9HYPH|nr:FAD-dependent oxidoreductase [Aureimonas altamirensis]KHJ55043.1 hypothetical protein LA66_10930 [Aureimonas altamirensis]
MIIDDTPDTAVVADICIVGSGPVGLALAFRCARQGLAVTVLEAGYPVSSGHRAEVPAVELLNNHHVGAETAVMRALGGTANLWGGRCVRFDDIDFAPRGHVAHSGWPIAHAELASHYPEALRFLGCEPTESPAETSDKTVDDGNTEWWSGSSDIAALHAEAIRDLPNLKIHTGCVARRLIIDPASQRVTAMEVERAGRIVRVAAGAFALAAGGLENTRLLLHTRRDRPDLFGGEDGPLGRFYCGHLTGYLAEIRFNDPRFARTLWFQRQRAGGVSRRRLTLSSPVQRQQALLNTAFWLESYSISDPAHGSGLLSSLYMAMKGLSVLPRVRTGLAPTGPKQDAMAGHFANLRRSRIDLRACQGIVRQVLRRGVEGKTFALFNPEGRYLLRYHAEHAPNPDSRAVLSADGRLAVDLRFSHADLDSVVRSHMLLDDWLQAERIGTLRYLAPPDALVDYARAQALDGYHQIGLTRMAQDRSAGVVDGDCRAFDLCNLYLAGSSVFPTAGQANPTLPAVALALRLGDHVVARVRAPSATPALAV